MFLQKLTKSYSNPLPVYEPLNSHFPPPETGSLSCTYSPQHSVGAARVIVQSAQIRESKGWKRFFWRKPSAWVKVKVLGRAKGEVVGFDPEGKEKGEIRTWREERPVGKTGVSSKTYTPNFGFKSCYALLGPYEKHIKLEVRNKRCWLWPFQRSSVLGSATFVLPSDLAPSSIGSLSTSLITGEYAAGHDSPSPSTLRVGVPVSRAQSRAVSHEEVGERGSQGGVGEWTVQAPMFDHDMSKFEGYLLFSVCWYPAIPPPFPPTVQGSSPVEGTRPTGAGIVSFTLHSIDHLDTAPNREIMATVSLGWHYPPLHTVGGPEKDIRSFATQRSANPSTESFVQRREMRRRRQDSDDSQFKGKATISKTYNSMFEFLCLDPSSTSLVVKVYEVYRGNVLLELGKKKRELLGHTTFPLLDLVDADELGLVNVDLDLLVPHRQIPGPEGMQRPNERDRILPLMGHPTAKVKVCVEWRALRISISEAHIPSSTHQG